MKLWSRNLLVRYTCDLHYTYIFLQQLSKTSAEPVCYNRLTDFCAKCLLYKNTLSVVCFVTSVEYSLKSSLYHHHQDDCGIIRDRAAQNMDPHLDHLWTTILIGTHFFPENTDPSLNSNIWKCTRMKS